MTILSTGYHQTISLVTRDESEILFVNNFKPRRVGNDEACFAVYKK